jgi:hypothetical protein
MIHIAEEVFQGHDELIDDRLMELVPGADRGTLARLRGLPLQQGGLGIPALCGVDSERHYAMTRRRVTAFLEEFHPHLIPVHRDNFYHGEGRRSEAIMELEEEAQRRMPEARDEGDAIMAFSRVARRVTYETIEAIRTGLQEELAALPATRGFAAQLRSSLHGNSGTWMREIPPFEGAGTFPEAAFKEALRNRLLVPFAGSGQRGRLPCTCRGDGPVDIAQDPTHPFVCPHSKGLIKGRHDAVRDRLSKFLRSKVPGGRVEVEPRRHQGRDFTRFPDIHVELAGST